MKKARGPLDFQKYGDSQKDVKGNPVDAILQCASHSGKRRNSIWVNNYHFKWFIMNGLVAIFKLGHDSSISTVGGVKRWTWLDVFM
jgi:hypothetical protein